MKGEKKNFRILNLLLVFCFSLMLTACEKPKTILLFNTQPITKNNLLNNSSEFQIGQKIYYIFITENPLKTDGVRIRVLKRDEKALNEVTKMVYSNDFRLYKDQIYYYNDYIVIHEAGNYCMVIHAKNGLDRPLVIGDFKVK